MAQDRVLYLDSDSARTHLAFTMQVVLEVLVKLIVLLEASPLFKHHVK